MNKQETIEKFCSLQAFLFALARAAEAVEEHRNKNKPVKPDDRDRGGEGGKTFFPIVIQLSSTKQYYLCECTEDIPIGQAFIIVETNIKKGNAD